MEIFRGSIIVEGWAAFHDGSGGGISCGRNFARRAGAKWRRRLYSILSSIYSTAMNRLNDSSLRRATTVTAGWRTASFAVAAAAFGATAIAAAPPAALSFRSAKKAGDINTQTRCQRYSTMHTLPNVKRSYTHTHTHTHTHTPIDTHTACERARNEQRNTPIAHTDRDGNAAAAVVTTTTATMTTTTTTTTDARRRQKNEQLPQSYSLHTGSYNAVACDRVNQHLRRIGNNTSGRIAEIRNCDDQFGYRLLRRRACVLTAR